MSVLIAGAGIGGLTLALELHARGIPCTVLEAAPALAPLGVGINLLPHATRALARLGLTGRLDELAVTTKESAFFTRFGQLIAVEPAGRAAGYYWPQYSVHRGDLHTVLLDAVQDRLPAGSVITDSCVESIRQDRAGASVVVRHADGSTDRHTGTVVIGADGVHSAVRAALHPGNTEPRYTGVMMWRGTTVAPPFLSGASMVRAGWLSHGKMVIYPIREHEDGTQLINWVAEVEGPQRAPRDWTRKGNARDFIDHFADWTFDWLDVPALIRGADEVLEYPMVDQDPLPWWGQDRVTLLGDAAHPMVPRGSNGAAQSILDAVCLAEQLTELDAAAALAAYEAQRRPATAQVVLTNRTNPPDALLRVVHERTGDRPFDSIDDVIAPAEITAMSSAYAQVAGMTRGEA
jgi:2-polyprenyl-6-methoxyphenol hydroxylase-like FAD-dependent oxidoreductase